MTDLKEIFATLGIFAFSAMIFFLGYSIYDFMNRDFRSSFEIERDNQLQEWRKENVTDLYQNENYHFLRIIDPKYNIVCYVYGNKAISCIDNNSIQMPD